MLIKSYNGRITSLFRFRLFHYSSMSPGCMCLLVQPMLCVLTGRRRSNDERISILGQDSSKKLFKKASSMSARIGHSCTPSSRHNCLTDTKSFSFDPVLLQSKVYHRVCESVWRREVTVNGEEIGENTSASSSPSISSNNAIVSQTGDSVPRPLAGASGSSRNSLSCPKVEASTNQAGGIMSPREWRATLLGPELQKISPNPPPQLALEVSTSRGCYPLVGQPPSWPPHHFSSPPSIPSKYLPQSIVPSILLSKWMTPLFRKL
jgi:hypothetical protein